MFFVKHFNQLYTLKSSDVEEPIDLFWHRPLAAFFTALGLSLHLPLTPNRITFISLAIGWTAGIFLYFIAFDPSVFGTYQEFLDPYGWLIAGALYSLSVIFDCADGQLARYRGGGTRMGRILDGIVDGLVAIPMYALMGAWVLKTFGSTAFWFTVFAGFNQWLQIATYDRIKTIYLARSRPNVADGTESRESIEAIYQDTMKNGRFYEKFGMVIYVRMLLQIQDIVTSKASEGTTMVSDVPHFRKTLGPWMRASSFLGLGTHMFLLYSAISLTGFFPESFLVVQVLFVSLFNIIFIIGIITTHRMLHFES